jgi:hypothetical protein
MAQEIIWLIAGLMLGSIITLIVITNSNDDSKVNGYYRD